MKTCSKCKVNKPLTDFSFHRRYKDGYQHSCKICVNNYHKKYYAENKDKINGQSKKYHAENKDKRNEQKKEYRAGNKDKIKEQWKKYYAGNKDKVKERSKKYYLRGGKQKIRSASLKRRYNITSEEYDIMYIAQNGQCSICSIKLEKLVVDHDHKTGVVRKLLCPSCNLAIGHLREDTHIVKAVLKYLEEYQLCR